MKDLYDLLPEGADPKLVTELRTMRVMSSRGPGWTKVAHLLGSSEEVFEALKAWHPKHEMLCLQPLARMVRTKPDFVQCGCTRRHKGRKLNQKLDQDDVEAGNTSTGRNNRQRGRLNAVFDYRCRQRQRGRLTCIAFLLQGLPLRIKLTQIAHHWGTMLPWCCSTGVSKTRLR